MAKREKSKARAHGEGSIYQRNDGRWVAAIPTGEGRKKQYVYRATQREARDALRELQRLKEKGVRLATKDQTLHDFLMNWLEDATALRVRARTAQRYCELVRLHILPDLGSIHLRKLTPQHLQRLYKSKIQAGYAPRTVKHIHNVLHKALGDALKWDLIPRNVCDIVDPPRVPRKEMHALTAPEALRFLEAAKGSPFEALFVLALTTGAREGELLGSQWQDFDFVQGTWQIQRTITRLPGQGFIVSEPKSDSSRRCILLTPMAIEALKHHRLQQREARLAAGPQWHNAGFVFTNSLGKPVEVSNLIRRDFRPLLQNAGLEMIRFHDLRHSAATLLLSLGIHPKIVQEILGHSQISLTMDTYSHALPSMQAEAREKLQGLLTYREAPIAVTLAVTGAANQGKFVK